MLFGEREKVMAIVGVCFCNSHNFFWSVVAMLRSSCSLQSEKASKQSDLPRVLSDIRLML